MSQEIIGKQFYSIGEVAKILGENTSLVRFWVKETGLFKLQTNKKGNRIFQQTDVEKLKQLHRLVKQKGFTLQGAKNALKLGEPIDPAIQENLKDRLISINAQLKAIRDNL
ncbi:MAG: MerR family transcriptional regulator [Flavobacteriales bacterium]